jgi:hypothetical protein
VTAVSNCVPTFCSTSDGPFVSRKSNSSATRDQNRYYCYRPSFPSVPSCSASRCRLSLCVVKTNHPFTGANEYLNPSSWTGYVSHTARPCSEVGVSAMDLVWAHTREVTIFYKIVIAQKFSNIHLVTKDYKIVPLTNLLTLLLAGRVVGGVCLVRLILVQQWETCTREKHCSRWVGVKGERA